MWEGNLHGSCGCWKVLGTSARWQGGVQRGCGPPQPALVWLCKLREHLKWFLKIGQTCLFYSRYFWQVRVNEETMPRMGFVLWPHCCAHRTSNGHHELKKQTKVENRHEFMYLIACGHFQHSLNSTSVSMATFFFVLSVLMISISTYKANIFKTKYPS